MKQIFQKITSFLIAIVVLFSTMSFTINMHFCGDTLVETAVFHKSNGCGIGMENPSSEGCSIIKKNCCDDKQILVEGQDELQLSYDNIDLEKQQFIALYVCAYFDLFEDLSNNLLPNQYYSPPLVNRDIQVLYEVYLI